MTWHEAYTQVLDLEAKKVVFDAPGYAGLDDWTLHTGEVTVGGIGPQLPAGMAPRWHTCFATDDPDASAKRVVELGGKLPMQPFDTPYGLMLIASDPGGATFYLIRPTKPFGKW
ncbi:MAG: hypothetical protein GY711_24050 [bacterium]|nr:hypothetical protein [bacterium]